MRFGLQILLVIVIVGRSYGQFHFHQDMTTQFGILKSREGSILPLPSYLIADRQLLYRTSSPMMRLAPSAYQGDDYWLGYMTTQSYNKGKLGTMYYWDIQGNQIGRASCRERV